MNIFFEVHQGLPREAPGDEASTLRALELMPELPASPTILDIGCGPGEQTIALARNSTARITAVDVHQPFLDELSHRALEAGVSERIKTLNMSMLELEFEKPFDVIWSEGAIYIIGFVQGLRAWRPLLKLRGCLAVTELSWIKPCPPTEIIQYSKAEYPGMQTMEDNLESLRAAGYRELGHFILPESAWWEPYYGPMDTRVAKLRSKYACDPDALRILDMKSQETELYRKYSDYYGYVFYVMQRDSVA